MGKYYPITNIVLDILIGSQFNFHHILLMRSIFEKNVKI